MTSTVPVHVPARVHSRTRAAYRLLPVHALARDPGLKYGSSSFVKNATPGQLA